MDEKKIDVEAIKKQSEEMVNGKKKEDLKPIKKRGNVVSTKPPLKERLANLLFERGGDDIKSYIIFDVIIPGVKDAILDTLAMMFYDERYEGRTRSRGHRRDEDRYGRTDYRGISNSGRKRRDRDDDRYERNEKIDYRRLIFDNRMDAEDIVEGMRDRIEDQGSASIADLLNLADLPSKYTDNNWGWTRKSDIGLRKVSRGGYLIDVAEARYLDD